MSSTILSVLLVLPLTPDSAIGSFRLEFRLMGDGIGGKVVLLSTLDLVHSQLEEHR